MNKQFSYLIDRSRLLIGNNEALSTRMALYCILALAGALRFWGLSWGLPLKKAHIDESVVIFYTMRFFGGDFNPHIFFDYPTFFLYLLWGVFFALFLAGGTVGWYASLDHFVGVYLHHDASLIYVAARLFSALFGLASVYVVYRMGRENFSAGLVPALLWAVLPVPVLHSHYATVDVAAVFWLLLSFLFLSRYYRRGQGSSLIAGSFVLGLATATKYYPAVFIAPLLYFVFEKERRKALPVICSSALFFAAGFVMGCPFSLLSFSDFSSRFIDRFHLIVWPASNAPSSFNFNPLKVLRHLGENLTVPLSLWSGAGILLALANKREREKVIFCLAFPLVYLLFLGTWSMTSVHYLMPAVPFLLIVAGYGWFLPGKAFPKRWIAILSLIIVAAPALIFSTRNDLLLTREDTRLQAHRWIRNNLPAGSKVLRLPYTPEFSSDDPFFVKVDWEGKTTGTSPDLLAKHYDYLLISNFSADFTSEWEQSLLARYRLIKDWPHVPLATFHHPRIRLYGK